MDEAIEQYKENGIGVWPGFIDHGKCDEIISEMRKLVSDAKLDATSCNAPKSIFSTKEESHEDRGEDQNFIKSSEDISFFWEENAFDSEGKLKFSPVMCLNKVGHALHTHGCLQEEPGFFFCTRPNFCFYVFVSMWAFRKSTFPIRRPGTF